MNKPVVHYNNRGYEATYNPATDSCTVVVRGYERPDGEFVERGGPAHPNDKPLTRHTIVTSCAAIAFWRAVNPNEPCAKPCPVAPSPIVETFGDALADRRDLSGMPVFRNKPKDDVEQRLFAAAYDAAQKVRTTATVLGIDKLFFSSYCPSLFTTVDCFCRDASGAFWLMCCAVPMVGGVVSSAPYMRPDGRTTFDLSLPLAAYVLEAGGYVPSSAAVRLGVWSIFPAGPRFTEVSNNRVAARDAVIAHLLSTPF